MQIRGVSQKDACAALYVAEANVIRWKKGADDIARRAADPKMKKGKRDGSGRSTFFQDVSRNLYAMFRERRNQGDKVRSRVFGKKILAHSFILYIYKCLLRKK